MGFNIILTIATGFLFAIILYFSLFKLYKYKGPNSNIIKKEIYRLNDKCYKFVPAVYMCSL